MTRHLHAVDRDAPTWDVRRAARAHARLVRPVRDATWRLLPDEIAAALTPEDRALLDLVIDRASLLTVCAVIDDQERRAS